jgi:hypothetical protein
MSEWAYRIIDHFGASRENVAISFEYLDRFYASGLNTWYVDGKEFADFVMT